MKKMVELPISFGRMVKLYHGLCMFGTAMSAAVRIVFPNTRHRLCLWHIYQNADKHLSHVINKHPQFISKFKKCVYEERSLQ
jgi:hypothetical protein